MPRNLGGWIFGGILIFATLCALEQNPGAFAALFYGLIGVFMREVMYPIAPFIMAGLLAYGAYRYWRSRR